MKIIKAIKALGCFFRATRLVIGPLLAASCLFAVDAAAQTLPVLSIDSPYVDEGDSGSANLTFTVTLSASSTSQVTVQYADAGTGTATSTDYTALTAGMLTFAAGTTSQTITVLVTGDTTAESDETVVIALSNPTNATLSATAGSGTGTIRDDDTTTPTLSVNSPTVTEGDSGSTNMNFTVSLSPASNRNVAVVFGITGGTATSGTDYRTSLRNNRIRLRFSPGQTSKTITLAVQGDRLDEPDETVVVGLSGVGFGARIGTGTGTGTITDDDDPPTISIDSPTVAEGDSGSTNMTFTVSLSATSGRLVTVRYGLVVAQSTATSGTDYRAIAETTANPGTLTLAPGETSKTITVEVLGDTADEPDETVRLQIASPTNATLGTNSRGDGIIEDDDLGVLRTGPASVTEGNTGSTNLTFTLTLTAPAGEEVTVNYADAGTGTATSGTDYTALTAGVVTIAAGQTTGTITVEVQGDTETEDPETVVVSLSNLTNATFQTASMNTLTGTIRDDDLRFLRTGPASVTEGDSGSTDMTFTLTLTEPAVRQVTVDYADTGRGTATSSTDYMALAAGTVTIPVGGTSGTITVSVRGDTVTERHETVVLALSNLRNARFLTASMNILTGTIRNDDGFPTVNAGPDQTVNEGDTVTLSGSGSDPDGSPITEYRWTQTAGPMVTLTGTTTATASFTAPTGLAADEVLRFSLVVTAGFEGGSDSVDILVNAATTNWTAEAGPNQTVEEDDTVSLSGRALSGGADLTLQGVRQPSFSWRHTAGGASTVDLTGANTATPSFTAPNLLANATLTFTLTVTVGNDTMTDTMNVTVEADNDDPTANAGADQRVYEGRVVTLSGERSSDPEGESLSYSWSQTGGSPNVALTGATTATPSFTAPLVTADVTLTFTLTVTAGGATDTDTVDVTVEHLVLAANAGPDQVVDEGDTVRLDGSGSTAPFGAGPLIYSWSQTGGSPAVTLTGATTATPSFTAPSGLPSDVTLTFTLTVTLPGEGGDSETDTVDVTVEQFGPVGSPLLLTADAGPDQTVGEGAAVSLDGSSSTAPFGEALSYSWRQTGGSPRVTLTGATTATPSFTAPDVTSDVTLTFALTVTAGGDSDTDTVDVTIQSISVPTLSIDSPSVAEGDSGSTSLTFTVSLSPASDLEVTVAYATADGTASAGTDYRAASGELRFAPGETELTISVPVLGDTRPEADETFTVTLSGPVNAELDRATAEGTILNDDGTQASIADARAEEGDSGLAEIDFRVALSTASDLEVTVAYATADGTASAGADYRATSGELRFAPGETELTISVPVLGDTRPEADETFTVTLSGPVNAELDRATAEGTIVNDDRTQASIADARAEEGDSGLAEIDFRVALSTASDLEVTVAYATADGTASAGADYRAASGELRFAPGETELTISVPVLGDTRPEADETFTVTLSGPVNAELDRATAEGTIVNDDRAQASIADARAEEGDSGEAEIDFRVALSTASDLEVTVAYATADGTASAGTDYRAASGELRFAPGETELTISVPVLGDTRPEADETFTVTLSGPVNAELDRATAEGTIVNDDRAQASIADARAEEGDSGEAEIDFRVALSTASDLEVTVAYATADGTASAGTDYRAASGELRFAPGETELTISVPVLGDTRPEADETFRVTLSGPVNAELDRMAATGVIVDDDIAGARDRALEASLAGFGRTLAKDAMNAISGRFRETPAASGSQVILGGQRLLLGDEQALTSAWDGSRPVINNFAAPSFRAFQDLAELDSRGPGPSQLSLSDFLRQSSFELALAEGGEDEDEGWNLSLWGRASSGRFSGQPLTGLSSQGEVVTGYLGMDAKVGERLFAGLALAHSDGEIGYGISDFAGELDVSLTSLLPYMNFQLSEKVEIWSLMGVGWGEGKFRDAVKSGQTEVQDARGKLDLGFSMAALGANRSLATWRNVDLELQSDAFVMFMKGEPEGNEAPSEVKAHSQGVRLMLAGRSELMASEKERLGLNLEFGGRWDGGDAQIGWGTEVGGGLDYRHAGLGLGVAVEGQYLLLHRAQSFEDKGVSLTMEFDPGVQGQGFSLALRPAWGAYSGGTGELWNNEALSHIGGTRQTGPGTASERLDLEWGYGFGLRGGNGLLRLQGALSHRGVGQRDYRFGGFLNVPGRTRISLELNRREGLGKPIHEFLIKWERRW